MGQRTRCRVRPATRAASTRRLISPDRAANITTVDAPALNADGPLSRKQEPATVMTTARSAGVAGSG